MNVAESMQLATNERLKAKFEKILQVAEMRARELESRAVRAETEKEILRREAECRVREAEEEVDRLMQEKEEAEREKEVAQQSKALAETRQQEIAAELAESEEKLQQLEAQWVVERREIQLTQQELGKGGWATVSVAIFRGVRVAAKSVHNLILSRYNVELFKREMDMAARIRHPNLLQFIGATRDEGQTVILTELMPTSLRNELVRDVNFLPEAVSSIALDVARALNYLHLMRPDPLIHRDISSANVLLQPLPHSRWRAKVSDYGTVNLQRNLTTKYPGNPCYSAPEAGDPTQQSPKMDIFSFGILLLEMLMGEFPDMNKRVLGPRPNHTHTSKRR